MISQLSPAVRRSATVLVTGLTSIGLSVVLAAPAMAEPSEGWPESDPVDMMHALLVLAGLPLLLFCLLYTSPSPRDGLLSRMPSSA